MATHTLPPYAPRTLCAALLLGAGGAWAQATPPAAPPEAALAPVKIVGRAPPTAGVAGFGDVPLERAPLQANVYDADQLRDVGAQRLSDLTRLDPGVSDAYNSEGYIDYLTVRGFVLDNRYNFRRDGLPISAETSIPLDNKARIEVLKGTSGIQAGTSAPGGLVNYVVKRPLETPLRNATLAWRQPGSVLGAVDLSDRFGTGRAFGLRLNAAVERLDPPLHDLRGHRDLFALAGDWRLGSDTLLEAEVEHSHRSQPSQPGFSLLGNSVPAPVDPRINLNNQPWTLPNVFDGTTGSLRWQQRLSADWRFVAHAARQQLRTDDRAAFPFGCTDPNPPPDGTYYADRYCPDGTFDLYDFRSENERRRTDAIDVSLQGKLATGGIRHEVAVGVLRSTVRVRLQPQVFNFAGTGNVQGTAVTPPAPLPIAPSTDRDEHATELYLRDAAALSERVTLWLGLRHTRLSRQSIQTDGSAATDYGQSFTTPWVAASYAFAPDQLVYASWGQGIESEVAPNLPRYTNPGQPLPALKSRQAEVGLKGGSQHVSWSVAAFDIVRPLFGDIGACDVDASCTHQRDGSERHRGVEANGRLLLGDWTMDAGAQWLHARREGAQDASLDGLEPTNVPARTLKLQTSYAVPQARGLTLLGGLVHESSRMVLPDNSAAIPGWTRFDLGARYEVKEGERRWILRAGIDNVFDKRAWRESPYQFGHAYLFPLAPRTLWVGLEVGL
jgi:iron complex outermembrane receptor protein